WGGPRREYAAIKFFLYTLLGSVLILIAMLGFYFTNLRDFVSLYKLEVAAGQLQREDVSLSEDQAFEQASINSFDMIALARGGRAGLEYLGNGGDVRAVKTRPAINEVLGELAEV